MQHCMLRAFLLDKLFFDNVDIFRLHLPTVAWFNIISGKCWIMKDQSEIEKIHVVEEKWLTHLFATIEDICENRTWCLVLLMH